MNEKEEKLGIKVLKKKRIKGEEEKDVLERIKEDVEIVVEYGILMKKEIIDEKRIG